MKKVLIGLLTLVSVASFGQTEISRVKERGENRELIYSRTNNQIVFKLSTNGFEEEIKTLDLIRTKNKLNIRGNRAYSFELSKKMFKATGNAYHWCWSSDTVLAQNGDGLSAATSSGPAAIVVAPLCATIPAVPAILGVIISPIDGLITVGNRVLSTETIAARKFAKLLSGKDTKASSSVFKELVLEIEKL